MRTRTLTCLAALLLCSGSSLAQPVLITAPQTVAPSQTTITPTAGGSPVPLATAEITIRGSTLTLNGRHAIASLVIERSGSTPGVLTHTAGTSFDYSSDGSDIVFGMEVTVSGSVSIQGPDATLPASRVDLDGRGFPARTGPGTIDYRGGGGGGGAGHGGAGSNGSASPGGGCYGSFLQPITFGSGGEGNCCSTPGPGGGRIKLAVGGSLTVDGLISAGGPDAGAGTAGGGSGGSIWITCATLTGSGTIAARGGAGLDSGNWGAGGGGRIVAEFTTSTFPDSGFDASGGVVGVGNVHGGAGTVYLKPASGTGTLIIDNKSAAVGEATEFTGAVTIPGDLVTRNGGAIGPAHTDGSMHLSVTGNATLNENSGFLADFRGHPARTGPGCINHTGGGGGGGAGHGGAGSNGTGSPGGDCYGSVTQPVDMGSGGGGSCCSSPGSGGGAMHLSVAGALTVKGFLTADGQGNIGSAGGGSGGSIWIDCASLAGTGLIRARGGAGLDTGNWGAGGGGRIAAYYNASSFPLDNFDASGGTIAVGNVHGGAGTVYLKPSSGLGTLLIDNKHTESGEATEFTRTQSFIASLLVRAGGYLAPKHQDDSMNLSFAGSGTIDTLGKIGADARGYPGRAGPGSVPWTGGGGGGGAGHGGAGSNGTGGGASGGDCYGSVTQPVTMGSGSGGSCCTPPGAGGGALRVTFAGNLENNGLISSDGQTPGITAGGGAGGSIWLTCANLSGSGLIRARGASGIDSGNWGAGGGGRIAAYFGATSFPQANFDASGGVVAVGNVHGGAGTVFLKPAASRATIIIDNKHTLFGEATEFSGVNAFDASLLVDNGGFLAPKHQDDSLVLSFTGGGVVGPLGKIGADARGYPGRGGPGAVPWTGGGGGGGAGHAGAGSNGSGTVGGGTYGSITEPVTMGSGGGGNCCSSPGAGGGALRISFGGDLRNNGLISANGLAPSGNTGGGAGGSLWITCDALSGVGFIEARGANGLDNANWGAGGGGRVATYFTTSTFPLESFHLAGGNVAFRNIPGGAGTLFLKPASQRGTLYIDNQGSVGEATEMTGEVTLDANLVVDHGGILGPVHADLTLFLNIFGDITINPAGRIGADGRGYAQRTGPGSINWTGGGGGGGGGHGGTGGNGSVGPGGPTYGNPQLPDDMGSGGGGSCCASGGAGGGLIQIATPGTLTVDGSLSANGQSPDGTNAGGGSGGALLVQAATISGSGFIQANGANGQDTANWGGGGGGRLALYACTLSVPSANIQANGGTGRNVGAPGTIFSAAAAARAQSARACAGSTITLRVVGAGASGPFHWRFNGVPLSDGSQPSGAVVSGSSSRILSIAGVTTADQGDYDCLVTTACGTTPTNVATFLVCASDFNCDGDTNADDLGDFITCYFSSPPCPRAEFNDDGDVNADDLGDFITLFFSGAC